jgi:hypothetical protein
MTTRQKDITRMALIYLEANIDDANDAFSHSTTKDPDNESGKILLGKKVTDSVKYEEVQAIKNLFK